MDRNFFSKKNSVLFQYLLSYFTILVLVVGVVSAISILTLRAVEEAAYTQSLAKMDRIQDSIDTHLRSVESFALTLVTREDVVAIAAARETLRPFHHYQVYNLIKELRRYEVSNDAYAEAYLYFSNEDFVVDSSGRRSSSTFFASSGYDMSLQQWSDLLNNQYFAEFKCFAADESIVEYWFPIPGHSEGFKAGVAVLRLKHASITRLMSSLLWSEDETIAVLSGDQVIFHTGKTADNLLTSGSDVTAGTNQVVLGGSVLSRTHSKVTDWVYLSALPQSYFIQQTKYLQSVVVLCIILSVVAILFYSIWGLRRHYLPIRHLVGILSDRPDETTANEETIGEYQMIEHAVEKILTNYDVAKKQLGMQQQAGRNRILSDLLNNRFDGLVSLDDTLHFYEISFKGRLFATYILYEWKKPEDPILDAPPADKLHKVFLELLRAEGFDAYRVEERGLEVGLVGLRPGRAAPSELDEMKQLLQQGHHIICDKYFLDLSLALGGAKEGTQGIAKSYREAASVVEYLSFLGKNQGIVCEYASIQENDVDACSHPGQMASLNQLANLIATKNFQQATPLALELLDEMNQKNYDAKKSNCLKFSMMNAVLAGLSVLQDEGLGKDGESLSEQLLFCDTITQLRQCMEKMLHDLDLHYKSKRAAHSNDVIQQIIGYIETNYKDYSMGVSQIADVFNLKVPFLSKLFKKQVGIGLLDYITQLRLSHIKTLLLHSNMNLNEIALEMGFINASTLIRTFKRYEGITPGKYKEAYQEISPGLPEISTPPLCGTEGGSGNPPL